MDWHAIRTPRARSVLENSSSVRTVRAIRSRKLISRSNGSSYPFVKNQQPFERLALSVREIHQPFKWLKLSVREFISRSNGSSYPFKKFISRSNGSSCQCKRETMSFFLAAVPTRQDFKTNRHALLNDACRYDYITQTVVTFLFFVYLR